MVRLGAKNDQYASRLLKVVLANEKEKKGILKYAKSLKGHAVYGKVYIRPDLTELQRDENRRLVAKAKEKREQVGPGKSVFIRRNRIFTRTIENSDATNVGNGVEGENLSPQRNWSSNRFFFEQF